MRRIHLWILILARVFVMEKHVEAICQDGRFGPECTYSCHCTGGQRCDVAGGCPDGCEFHWSGRTCQKENIAYLHSSHQKTGGSSSNATFAVDDDVTSCSATKQGVPGWWSLDLVQIRSIQDIRIVSNATQNIKGWRIYAGLEDSIFSMTLCTTISFHGDGASVRCDFPTKGRYIRIVNTLGPVVLCDFSIFACPEKMFGEDCTHQCGRCHNNQSCDQDTGHCLQGCETGWTGRTCNASCPAGFYGQSCLSQCGHCVQGSDCEPRFGVCPLGCSVGWQGLFCTKECDNGQYGPNCANTCIKCNSHSCSRLTGDCLGGCAPGYTGSTCDDECPDGQYGQACRRRCRNCAIDSDRSCDSVTGECLHGCNSGYNGTTCTQSCQGTGYYGAHCELKCGVCKPGTSCDAVNGVCPSGCADGFYGDACSYSEDFSDVDGPQLKIFLGLTITVVAGILILVTVCLVLVWNRERQPATPQKPDEVEELSPLNV